MRPVIAASWWHRTSTEARLAQVLAGVELGLTARQIALASGASTRNVLEFAAWHDISLFRLGRAVAHRIAMRKRSARTAYDRGEPVNFWSSDPRIHRRRVPDDVTPEVVFE